MLLGLPLETKSVLWERPWTTWAMVAVTLAVALATIFGDLGAAVTGWGFVPAEPFRHGGLTWLTSFFLHAGLFHLITNLYFLWVFGDDVEDYLRPGRFLLLLLGATLAGHLLYGLLAWGSPTPSVGASGGISGILAFYALSFPRARLKYLILIPYGYAHRRVTNRVVGFTLSARWAFGIWVALQLWIAWKQMGGRSHVNALAHLGGAAVGFALWWIWREKEIPVSGRGSGVR